LNQRKKLIMWIPIYGICFLLCIWIALFASRAVTAMVEGSDIPNRICFAIDPGHGGEDGGAVSPSGIKESQINLEISLRLRDLLHFMGYETYMLRTEDISLNHTEKTIAARKAADLKTRAATVNALPNAVLISIHQNCFPDPKYYGPQVFYGKNDTSEPLAAAIQEAMNQNLNNKRQIKKGEGIYLLEKAAVPAVLIECGFLSNPQEEHLLTQDSYQKKLCCVIASACSMHFTS